MIKRALIHVENTENILSLAQYLSSEHWTIFSAGKTEELLRKNQINVLQEPALTDSTIYFDNASKIMREILQIVTTEQDELIHQDDNFGISLICMNTYPTFQLDLPEHKFRDFSRPQNFIISSFIRQAYQNYENIILLTDPADYQEAIIQLKTDHITDEFKTYLAAKALNFLAAYDAAIASSILRSKTYNEHFMNWLTLPFRKESVLKDGSNAQQEACLYKYPGDFGVLSGLSKFADDKLNYNIASDVSIAWELISTLYLNLKSQYTVRSVNPDGYEFTTQFTPLTGTVFTLAMKFGLIVGAALSTNVLDSFNNTYQYDTENILDVTLGCSAVIDEEAAKEIAKGNFIAIVAPGFTPEAKEILSANPKIKLISNSIVTVPRFDGRLINGGFLVQNKDYSLFDYWMVKTKNRPSQQITDEMAFGTLLSMGAHSYTALLIKQNHIVSIAQALPSCEQALQVVLSSAKKDDDNSIGDILVSDAPIIFTDTVKKIIDSGIYGIIQPGGYSTDNELIDYCNQRGIVMIFTEMTHYSY